MVVVDERLNRRLLIDDHEPIRAANHVLEFFALVARDKGEAIVLAPNLLVLGNGHLDLPRAGNVFARLVRHGRPVQVIDVAAAVEEARGAFRREVARSSSTDTASKESRRPRRGIG
jgi:hypothetical protein